MRASTKTGPSGGGDDQPAAAPIRLGRFELTERIGVGGMAEVFRAAVRGPEGFRRELVVKRVLPELTARPRFVQMFVNEAKISALLTHPGIVQIFEFGEADGAYFIAMESIRGLTLRAVLTKLRQQRRTMPVVAAAEIIREVLVALDYAHNLADGEGRPLEIIHRDISPSNVMVTDGGTVKVLDFGIARAADLVADDEGLVVKGKIAYLAPEQIACGFIDRRVDVFAVGCVLSELLTGRMLFRAQNDLQKKIELLAQPTQPPSAWNADVPPALDAIVLKSLERAPDDRYASAAEMLVDVENYLAAFRSSSRAVLRLVRSLAEPAAEGEGTSAAADARAQASAPTVVPSGARTQASLNATAPLASGPTASTLPERFVTTPDVTSSRVLSRSGPSDAGTGVGSGRAGTVRTERLGGAANQEGQRFARARYQRRALVALGLIGGIAMAIGGVMSGRHLLHQMGRPSLVAPAAAAPAQEPFVLLTFQSTPKGARIIDVANGGRTLGVTPATLPITPSSGTVTFRFEKDGFLPATALAVPDRDKPVDVTMKPLRRVEKPARRATPTKRTAHRH